MSAGGVSRILLVVDGGPASEAASAVAAALAKACGASLTALAAGERTLVPTEAEGGIPVETVFAGAETDFVSEVVRRAKNEIDLVVVGSSSSAGRFRGALSLRLWELARSIPTPVLLVPEGSGAELKQILLCTGGELYIHHGILFTAALASALGAEVTVLHVLPERPGLYRSLSPPAVSPAGFLAGENHLARQLRAQMAALEKLNVSASLVIEEGLAERTILEAARRLDARMIVVGSSPARGVLGASILGNVTREIASRSSVPVLVVRSNPRGLLRDLWRILRDG
ncbi:MAG: universal stress protein [Thermoanaerobaculia bacterium]